MSNTLANEPSWMSQSGSSDPNNSENKRVNVSTESTYLGKNENHRIKPSTSAYSLKLPDNFEGSYSYYMFDPYFEVVGLPEGVFEEGTEVQVEFPEIYSDNEPEYNLDLENNKLSVGIYIRTDFIYSDEPDFEEKEYRAGLTRYVINISNGSDIITLDDYIDIPAPPLDLLLEIRDPADSFYYYRGGEGEDYREVLDQRNTSINVSGINIGGFGVGTITQLSIDGTPVDYMVGYIPKDTQELIVSHTFDEELDPIEDNGRVFEVTINYISGGEEKIISGALQYTHASPM